MTGAAPDAGPKLVPARPAGQNLSPHSGEIVPAEDHPSLTQPFTVLLALGYGGVECNFCPAMFPKCAGELPAK